MKLLIILATLTQLVYSILRLDRLEGDYFKIGSAIADSKHHYSPGNKRWLIAQKHGSIIILDETIDLYFGYDKETKQIAIPHFVGLNEPRIRGMFECRYNGANYIAVAYTSTGVSVEKVVILKENGGQAEFFLDIPTGTDQVDLDRFNTVYVESLNQLYFVANNREGIIKADLALTTSLMFPTPASLNTHVNTLEQIESATKLVACDFTKNCEVLDPTSAMLTSVSTFQAASSPDPTVSSIERYLMMVLNYERTHTAAVNLLLLGMSHVELDGSAFVNKIEVVDYVNYPGTTNIVIEGAINQPLHSIVGIHGTAFCIIAYRTPMFTLVNPSAQAHGSTMIYTSTLDMMDDPSNDKVSINYHHPIIGTRNILGSTFVYVPALFKQDSISKFGMARVSICGGVGCNQCNTQLTDCNKCQEGVQLFQDPVFNDQICVSMCPNPSIEVLSAPNKRCINCLTEANLDTEACWMTKDFNVVEILPTSGLSGSDEFSSHTFKVNFSNSSNIIQNMVKNQGGENKIQIGEKLLMQIPSMENDEYTARFIFRKNQIMIDLNFTANVDTSEQRTMVVSVKTNENIFARDTVGDKPLLIFNSGNDTIAFNPNPLIDTETLEQMKTTSKQMSQASSVAAGVGLGATVAGIALQLPIMAFFIKFILIMKILNRFKFMNINFGPVLGTFLNGIFNLFELGDPTIEPQSYAFDTKTRGKLTYYRYDVLVFYKIFEKFIIYIIIFVLDMIRFKVFSYTGSMKAMLPRDRFFCSIVEKVKFLIFSMYAQDLVLFSVNELARHDLTVQQDGSSLASYGVVFCAFCFITWDVCRYTMNNRDIPVLKILSEQDKEKLKSKAKKRRAVTQSKELTKLAIDVGREPGQAGGTHKNKLTISKNRNSKKPSGGRKRLKKSSHSSKSKSGSSGKSLRSKKSRNESIAAKKNRMMKLKTPFDVYNQSLIQFSRNAIDPLKLYMASSRWYNILFLVRLLIFEVNFIALQMLPRTQCVLIFLIQVCFAVFTWVSAAKNKIFENCVTGVLACVNETFITSFLILCIWISYDGPLKVGGQNWVKIQKYTVYAIMLVGAMNIILVLFTILGQIRLAIREANRKQHKKRVTNVDISNPLLSHQEDNMMYRENHRKESHLGKNSKKVTHKKRKIKNVVKKPEPESKRSVVTRKTQNMYAYDQDQIQNEDPFGGGSENFNNPNRHRLSSFKNRKTFIKKDKLSQSSVFEEDKPPTKYRKPSIIRKREDSGQSRMRKHTLDQDLALKKDQIETNPYNPSPKRTRKRPEPVEIPSNQDYLNQNRNKMAEQEFIESPSSIISPTKTRVANMLEVDSPTRYNSGGQRDSMFMINASRIMGDGVQSPNKSPFGSSQNSPPISDERMYSQNTPKGRYGDNQTEDMVIMEEPIRGRVHSNRDPSDVLATKKKRSMSKFSKKEKSRSPNDSMNKGQDEGQDILESYIDDLGLSNPKYSKAKNSASSFKRNVKNSNSSMNKAIPKPQGFDGEDIPKKYMTGEEEEYLAQKKEQDLMEQLKQNYERNTNLVFAEKKKRKSSMKKSKKKKQDNGRPGDDAGKWEWDKWTAQKDLDIQDPSYFTRDNIYHPGVQPLKKINL